MKKNKFRRGLPHPPDHIGAFWRAIESAPQSARLGILKHYATLTVPRRKNYREIRHGGHTHGPASQHPCFACHRRPASCWHHVIQVQYGGRNRANNMVAICHVCHCEIHPWMTGAPVVWPYTPMWE